MIHMPVNKQETHITPYAFLEQLLTFCISKSSDANLLTAIFWAIWWNQCLLHIPEFNFSIFFGLSLKIKKITNRYLSLLHSHTALVEDIDNWTWSYIVHFNSIITRSYITRSPGCSQIFFQYMCENVSRRSWYTQCKLWKSYSLCIS